MRNPIIHIIFTVFVLLLVGNTAYAQLGPDLRPPGLPAEHPIEAFSMDGSIKHTSSDWLYAENWDLNASEVVFSASKKRQLISEAPSTIHVITDKQIATHGWRTLSEVLRHVPGVQTLTTQSQFQSVMIRGLVGTETNNSRILWLQNGVPFNDVRDSGVWIDETYPIELIKRIEVVLGPGSALYGSGAFQGVINIFTKDPKDIPKYGEYRVGVANNLTFKSSAIAAYHSEDSGLGLLLHITGNTTQGPGLIGDYVYEKKLMTQAGNNVSNSLSPTSRDPVGINANSDKHWYAINAKLNYKQFKANLGFADIYAGGDGSEIIPNVGYRIDKFIGTGDQQKRSVVEVKNSRFNRREFTTDLFYEDTFSDSLSFTAVLSYRLNQYTTENYGGYGQNGKDIVYIDYSGREPTQNDVVQAPNYPVRFETKINFNTMQHKLYGLAQLQWRIYEQNELITGLVAEYQNIHAPEFLYSTNKVANRTELQYITPSIFIQDEQRFLNNRLILTAGGRVDFYKLNATYKRDIQPSWRFAALVKWADWITQRVSYGYAFKEPSLYQLYIDTIDYKGNPELKPESLHNIELSTLFTPWYFLTLRLDAYATFMKNLIRMQWDSKLSETYIGVHGKYTPKQDSGANIFGFELSAEARLANAWKIYGHYNFLYSTRIFDKTVTDIKNTHIKDDAMHRARLGASYVDDNITADLALFLVSSSPDIDLEDSPIEVTKQNEEPPLYFILQPHLTIRLPGNFGLLIQASYAFSKGMTQSPSYRYYYESRGIPVSRFSTLFSLTYPYIR